MIAARIGTVGPAVLDAVRAEVVALPDDAWTPHFNTRTYEGDWSAAPLRSLGGDPHHIYPDPTRTDFKATPYLVGAPATASVLDDLDGILLSARFLRLGVGSRILEHRDHALGLDDGEVRLHLPVVADEGAELHVAGRPVPMRTGEWWYCDLNQPHRAHNASDRPRVHLVVDCIVDDALRVRIERAAPALGTAEAVRPSGCLPPSPTRARPPTSPASGTSAPCR
jgi:hypothetical protein